MQDPAPDRDEVEPQRRDLLDERRHGLHVRPVPLVIRRAPARGVQRQHRPVQGDLGIGACRPIVVDDGADQGQVRLELQSISSSFCQTPSLASLIDQKVKAQYMDLSTRKKQSGVLNPFSGTLL